jgi:putative addiction module killer protein
MSTKVIRVITVKETKAFTTWFSQLRDKAAMARIETRLERLISGNPGDVRPVGGGVSELRINYGPGYRIYFIRRGDVLIILLCGGDKSSQARDIIEARRLAEQWKT